jgi:hypothetical protein
MKGCVRVREKESWYAGGEAPFAGAEAGQSSAPNSPAREAERRVPDACAGGTAANDRGAHQSAYREEEAEPKS